jgi:hypothetical protein
MTGEGSEERRPDKEIPASLARFAAEQSFSVRETMTLLDVQERLVAARRKPRTRLDRVDWKALYEAMKKFL